MPDKTIRLGDARDDLAERRETVAENLAGIADDDDPDQLEVARLRETGSRVDRWGRAVAWACDEWGEDATIDLQRLDTERDAQAEDYLAANYANPGEGVRRQVRVALAVTDAPFYGRDVRDLDDRVDAVGDIPYPDVVKWLAREVEDLATPDPGNWQPFGDLLQAKRSTPTTTSSSDTSAE